MIKRDITITLIFFCCFIFFNLSSMKLFRRKKKKKEFINIPLFQDQGGVKALNTLHKEKFKKDEIDKYKKTFGWHNLGKSDKEETILIVEASVAFKNKLKKREKGKYKRISSKDWE